MSEKHTRCKLVFAVAALAAAVALAGCSDADDDDDADAGGSPTATEPPAAPEGTGGDGSDDDGRDDDWNDGSDELGLRRTDLETVIVDDDDRTLYLFTEDSEGAPTCYDECASDWPPLLAEDDDDDDDRHEIDVDDGLDAALVGTVERENGATQVTYNGHPLYYWTGDTAPGDTEGQGRDDAWYVLDAQGEAVTDAP